MLHFGVGWYTNEPQLQHGVADGYEIVDRSIKVDGLKLFHVLIPILVVQVDGLGEQLDDCL